MKTIRFTIYGNQEDPNGNPMAYFRTTQGSQWTPKARRYQEWKSYVVANYLDALGAIKKIDRADFGDAHDLIQRKPIKATKEKIRMKLKIYFKDKTHADSDNIFKGIADALFMNDKYLAGEFDFDYTPTRGRVEIEINL
jgi:hypothetical protein